MEPLADSYNRYRDLEQELKTRDKSVERLLGTLGDEEWPDALLRTADAPEMDTAAVVLGSLPLGESVRQILSVAEELREVEIYDVLSKLGHKTTTSAIQSALRTHPEVFKVRTRGRMKFVSLKK